MKNTLKKPLHLIIEGSDKVGKTTICKLLSRELKIPVIKMKDMPKFFDSNPEVASEVFNKTIQQFKDYSFILDRGYPTSIVYSTYFSRKYPLNYLDDVISELKPVVFVLNAIPRKKDDLITKTAQNEIRDMYSYFALANHWNVLECNKLKPKEICKKILEKI